MPYITEPARRTLEHFKPAGPGELNYAITKLCTQYLRTYGTAYSTINEIIGVLECAKIEFYRRVAEPYEDGKILENGDVYDPPPGL